MLVMMVVVIGEIVKMIMRVVTILMTVARVY